MKEFKTIIIGGGPAGLTAGRFLNDAVILEKEKEIGKPVQCGEAISRNAFEMQSIEPKKEWVSSKIYKIKRILPNGDIIASDHKKPTGYILERDKFEKFLAEKAKAEIKLNCEVKDLTRVDNKWKVKTKKREYLAKYLIGADGPNSIVRRKIFPDNKIKVVPGIQYLIKASQNFNTSNLEFIWDNNKFDKGYAWVFPKSKNTANVGVIGENIKEKKLQEFLKERFKEFEIIKNKSGIVPFKKGKCSFQKDNAFLVGDAAGFADPFFKGGMNQAMLSAKILSELILKGKTQLFNKKIKKFPFANENLLKRSNDFYSLSNNALNEIAGLYNSFKKGNILSKTSSILSLYSKLGTKETNILLKFFYTWKKSKKYLW